MTGGDFALVKSVEFFEDFQSFGRHQVRDLGLGSNDMLVAITEGGETSSVLGTVFESVERGLKVFLLFNNPANCSANIWSGPGKPSQIPEFACWTFPAVPWHWPVPRACRRRLPSS